MLGLWLVEDPEDDAAVPAGHDGLLHLAGLGAVRLGAPRRHRHCAVWPEVGLV